MSKLSQARELLEETLHLHRQRRTIDIIQKELLKSIEAIDLSDDLMSLDEKALLKFEDAVCYEVMIRKEKIGRNMTDELINAIKRVRRKKEFDET